MAVPITVSEARPAGSDALAMQAMAQLAEGRTRRYEAEAALAGQAIQAGALRKATQFQAEQQTLQERLRGQTELAIQMGAQELERHRIRSLNEEAERKRQWITGPAIQAQKDLIKFIDETTGKPIRELNTKIIAMILDQRNKAMKPIMDFVDSYIRGSATGAAGAGSPAPVSGAQTTPAVAPEKSQKTPEELLASGPHKDYLENLRLSYSNWERAGKAMSKYRVEPFASTLISKDRKKGAVELFEVAGRPDMAALFDKIATEVEAGRSLGSPLAYAQAHMLLDGLGEIVEEAQQKVNVAEPLAKYLERLRLYTISLRKKLLSSGIDFKTNRIIYQRDYMNATSGYTIYHLNQLVNEDRIEDLAFIANLIRDSGIPVEYRGVGIFGHPAK